MTDKLEILATPFDDPSLCRFTMAGVELTSSEIVFRTSPSDDFFIQDLFGLDGICEVTVDKNYIICKKTSEITWPTLGKTIGNLLRIAYKNQRLKVPSKYFSTHQQSEQPMSSGFVENEDFIKSDIGKKIQEIIELQIQPSLGAHGGSVKLLDLNDGKLLVTFSGGCQGCSQASVTVKEGIQRIIVSKFDEVSEVIDVTDHGLGTNPYFK